MEHPGKQALCHQRGLTIAALTPRQPRAALVRFVSNLLQHPLQRDFGHAQRVEQAAFLRLSCIGAHQFPPVQEQVHALLVDQGAGVGQFALMGMHHRHHREDQGIGRDFAQPAAVIGVETAQQLLTLALVLGSAGGIHAGQFLMPGRHEIPHPLGIERRQRVARPGGQLPFGVIVRVGATGNQEATRSMASVAVAKILHGLPHNGAQI